LVVLLTLRGVGNFFFTITSRYQPSLTARVGLYHDPFLLNLWDGSKEGWSVELASNATTKHILVISRYFEFVTIFGDGSKPF